MRSHWFDFSRAVVGVVLGLSLSASAGDANKPGQAFRDCPNCPEMIVIPAGKYLMGTSMADTERASAARSIFQKIVGGARDYSTERERPQHAVALDRLFGLGKYPVTRGEFAIFAKETHYPLADCTLWENHKFKTNAGGSREKPGFDQTDRDPVVCVSYQDANAYIAWLNSQIGGAKSDQSRSPYHLPSEAQWEFAARAGSQTAYWWGDDVGRRNAVCNECASKWDPKGTAPADSFHANPFGLFSMLGNVWEITEDCWHPSYVGAPKDGSVWTTGGDCQQRVIRGASWINDASQIRSAARSHATISMRVNVQGFRVAREL